MILLEVRQNQHGENNLQYTKFNRNIKNKCLLYKYLFLNQDEYIYNKNMINIIYVHTIKKDNSGKNRNNWRMYGGIIFTRKWIYSDICRRHF